MTPVQNPVMRKDDGVTLCEHFSMLLTEVDRRYEMRYALQEQLAQQRFEAMEQALKLASENLRIWQINANEWRGAMSDRERTFVTCSEYSANHKNLADKVDALESKSDTAAGKASVVAVIATAIPALIGLILGVVNLFNL